MMSKITYFIERGRLLREFIISILDGKFPDEHKDTLLIGYLSLALEHHCSVTLLIGQEKFGSAFALLRALIEIVFRAHWVVGCATQPQIDQIHQEDKFKFPGVGQMAACIDAVFNTGHFFRNWKKNAWGPLNSHAHSGLLALGRRFSGQNVQPNFGETEVIEAVHYSNASLLLLGKMFFTHFNRVEDAKTIESFLKPELPPEIQ